MSTQILWWACNVLEALLILRAAQKRLYFMNSMFYLYLTSIFLTSLSRFYVYVAHPKVYPVFYWSTQFLSVIVGYGVVCAIYKQALEDYPGAARMGKAILIAVFMLVVGKAFGMAFFRSAWSPVATAEELEASLRTVQALLLAGVVGLLVYYSIPIGRNLKGLIVGYGFYIATCLINLNLRSFFGDWFQPWLSHFYSASYLIALLIWTFALWSYQPNPKPVSDVSLERDYQFLASRTRRLLETARSHIMGAHVHD
jgi:hypothetical protein